MARDTLTQRQQDVLAYIHQCIEAQGYGPTVREIAQEFGIRSPNGVTGHLRALQQKGMIQRAGNKSRAIELSEDYLNSVRGLPLAGVVSAGKWLEAVEDDERVDVGEMFSRPGSFALRVQGDSMIGAHIESGDLVIVEPRRTARRGEIVVARTDDGEATVKYFFPEKNRIRLQPANPQMRPMYAQRVKILGVVTGIIRKLR